MDWITRELPRDRSKGNRHKLKHEKLQVGIRKKVHNMGSLTLKQAVQRGCGISTLGDTQNSIRHIPEPPAVSCPHFMERAGPDGIQRLLPN